MNQRILRFVVSLFIASVSHQASALDISVQGSTVNRTSKTPLEMRVDSSQAQFNTKSSNVNWDFFNLFALDHSKTLEETDKKKGWSLLPQIYFSDLQKFLHCSEAVSEAEKKIVTLKRENSALDQTLKSLGLEDYQVNLTAKYHF